MRSPIRCFPLPLLLFVLPALETGNLRGHEIGPYFAGDRALWQMRLVISPAAGELRTQSVSPVPLHNRMGAGFVPRFKEDPVLVAHVPKDSPAADAGLEDGDVLVEIDGTDYRTGRSDAGKSVVLSFTRPAGTTLKL